MQYIIIATTTERKINHCSVGVIDFGVHLYSQCYMGSTYINIHYHYMFRGIPGTLRVHELRVYILVTVGYDCDAQTETIQMF